MNVSLCAGVLSRAIDSANANHNFKSRGGGGGGGGGKREEEEEEKERREGRVSVSGVSGDSIRDDETVKEYVRSASTSTDAAVAACVSFVVAVLL